MKKILIIGAGNIGYHLAKQYQQASKKIIVEVANRRDNDVIQRLNNDGIKTYLGLKNIPDDANMYLICVKDNAILDIARKLAKIIPKRSLVVHTSGAVDQTILSHFTYYGCLYPLYSFSKNEDNINWSNIPIFVVSDNVNAEKKILKFASLLNPQSINIIDELDKIMLHIMAVFGNNFTNALMCAIHQILHSYVEYRKNNPHSKSPAFSNIEQPEIIYQYISNFAIQTIERSKKGNPINFQTGPAIRNDSDTIDEHLFFLNNIVANKEITQLYLHLTEFILNYIKSEKK
ncbi:MAG: DUF2520 domain-containing protein [Bacteroidia bacterium]